MVRLVVRARYHFWVSHGSSWLSGLCVISIVIWGSSWLSVLGVISTVSCDSSLLSMLGAISWVSHGSSWLSMLGIISTVTCGSSCLPLLGVISIVDCAKVGCQCRCYVLPMLTLKQQRSHLQQDLDVLIGCLNKMWPPWQCSICQDGTWGMDLSPEGENNFSAISSMSWDG